MSAYSTVVVGTDGSDSSYRAVDRAGAIAGAAGAKLIVATAYFPENNPHSADVLKDDAYKVTGKAPVYDILRTARERAAAAGATSVEERSIEGAPVDALLDLVVDSKADLLVVGNVGLNTIAGRLLGSVPSDVARRSKCDVLIVHTT